jgi:hypothetical protein
VDANRLVHFHARRQAGSPVRSKRFQCSSHLAGAFIACAEQRTEVPGSSLISRDDLPADAINLIAGSPSGHDIDVAARLFIDNVVGHF